MIELIIIIMLACGLYIGLLIGILLVLFIFKHRLSNRCWAQMTTRDYCHRCIKHQGHEGKHYWTDLERTKFEEWEQQKCQNQKE